MQLNLPYSSPEATRSGNQDSGRPKPKEQRKEIVKTFRLRVDQAEKLERLGGSDFLLKAIDEAEEPKENVYIPRKDTR